ncbi:calcium-binding protein, partial [Tychonema bourrellyi]|uniref:calcium-binding protein n=1 Tax=Tychonema bourrellyi TaxID=54313 RepID=UPI001FE90115
STPATATLTAANQPPVIKNTSGSVLPGNTLGVTGLGGTDPDGSIKSFTINTLPPATEGVLFLGDPANGGVLVTAGQVLTPAEIDKLFFKSTGAFTEANFTYTATDNQGLSSSTPATATLTAANQPPVINNANAVVAPNSTVPLPGLGGTDPDGSIASFTINTLPPATQGVLFLGDPANGGVAVTPGRVLKPEQIGQLFFRTTGDFTGANFSYSATDSSGASSSATATLGATSTPIPIPIPIPIPTPTPTPNQPPVATNANLSISPNSSTPITGLGGIDRDGSIASFTINTLPPAAQGVLFLGDPANGGIAVTPGQVLTPAQIGQLFFRTTGDFTGANFSYSATDSSGATSPATATLAATSTPISTPTPLNQAPVANNLNLTIPPNSSTPITGLGGTDPDGSIASFTITTLPPTAQGVLFLGDPALGGGVPVTVAQTITPEQIGQLFFRTTGEFTGANFSYSATDNNGATSPATATVAAVLPTPNQPPLATNANLSIPPNSTTRVTGLGGTDPDGSIASFTITTLPPTAQGILFLGDPANGGVAVTPGQVLTPSQIGQLFFRTTGEFTGANFSYSATDNNGATSPATATVAAVLPTPNQPPLATNANLSIPPNSTTRVTGLGGTDPDGSIASFTITTLPPTAQGILFLGDPANGGVAVTPGQVLTPSQIGQLFFRTTGEFTGANFSYSATDNNGATSPATATVATVPAPASNSTQNPTPTPTPNPLNEPPVSTNVNFSIPPNSSTRVTGLGGTDTDGSIASFTINTLPPSAQGVLFLGDPANGGIAVTPGQVLTPAQIGQLFFRTTGEFTGANFTYSATDNQGATSPATATVAALLPTSNQPPVATNTNLSIAPNSTTPVTGLSATDPDGTIAFFTINTLPPAAQGTLFLGDPALGGGVAVTVGQTITPERIGQLFFQATANFTGGTFTYSATDNNGATSPGSATVAAILRPVLPTPTPTPSPEPDMDCGCDSVVEKPEIRFLPATQPPEVSFNQPGVPIAVEQQTLKGTNGNDSILGGNANEKIIGFQGGDLILGEGGTDEIYGDEGNDIIFGGLGSDVVYGGENNDLILAGKGNDWIAGELGSDTILGDRGADTILGDTGQNNSQNLDDARDLIFGGDSADVINGNEGDDTIHGGKGNDIALGGKNKDLILGEQGSDTLIGGSGDDSLFGGNLDNRAKDFEGRDVLYGGDGNDFLNGQEGDDTLISGKNDDRAYGGKGNDLIFGQLGSDTLYGNEGIDTILGDSGSFEPVGDAVEQDLIFGGTGGDIIGGGNGNDTVYAGKGSDYVWGGKDNDLIWGELGNDTLLGDSGDDTLYGGVRGLVKDTNGKDLLLGNIGSDLLFGDESDDTISGGKSNDSLFGGKGNDFIHGDQDDDLIYGGDGSDVLCGDDGNDTIYGDRADDKGVSVGSTEQQDCINGGAGNDLIYGNEGEDELNGEAGNDTLYGGKDNDILFGGEGDDILFGGSGDNTLSGGVGSDQFILGANGLNTILNFEVGIDKLVLTGGLTFQQLQFTSTQNGTLLRVVGTGQVLANLVGGIGAIGPNDVRSNLF